MKQLIILILIAVGIVLLGNTNEYVEIPSSSIRMRVIAASDSPNDQKDKMVVKSFVEEKLYELIGNSDSSDKVEMIIEDNKDEIDGYLKDKVAGENLDVALSTNFGYNYFPEKEFKGLVYKAGNYKSFVVTLGEGEGENWWCVLYPPLCLIDEQTSEYEYHSLIKDTILKYN